MRVGNISKSFTDHPFVLNNFSCSFVPGQWNFVTGESGSGKTTLLRIIMGLEKADSGLVDFDKGSSFSCVFQEDRLVSDLSVYRNIRFTTSAAPEAVASALSAVGLEGVALQKAGTLSGGQQRRVAIVRAVLSDADVLVMDEPFKGLDEETKLNVMRWVKENTQGRTVIAVTHDISEPTFFGASAVIKIC